MAPRRRERRPSEASSPAPLSLRLAASAVLAVPNQAGGLRSTTILPTPIVGRIGGLVYFPRESLTAGFGEPAGPHANTHVTFLVGRSWCIVRCAGRCGRHVGSQIERRRRDTNAFAVEAGDP